MRFAGGALLALLWWSGLAVAAPGEALVVASERANVRVAPDLEAAALLQVREGQLVIERERRGDWIRAEIAGMGAKVGWIHGSMLTDSTGVRLAAPVAEEAPSASAAPVPLPRLETEPADRAPAPEPGAPLTGPDVAAAVLPNPPPPEPATGMDELPPRAAEAGQAAPADGAGQARPDAGSASEEAGRSTSQAMAPTVVADRAGGLAQFRETVHYLNGRALQVAGVDLFTGVEAVTVDTVQVGTTEAWASMPPAGQESYLNTLLDRWLAARGHGPASVRIVDPGGRVVLEKSKP